MKNKNEGLYVFSKKTQDTPRISINESGVLIIEGRSYMDSPADFYKSIHKELKILAAKGAFNSIVAKIEYWNSASSREITDIFKILDEVDGSFIVWQYEDDDEDVYEDGLLLQSTCKSEFSIVELEN